MSRTVCLIALFVAFGGNHLHAQPRLAGEPQRITPADETFQQPVWSPDGRWIAVTGAKYNGIYLVSPDGRKFQKLTTDTAVGFGMSWSADGRFLVGRAARWEKRRRFNAVKAYDVETGESFRLSDERTFMPAIPTWDPSNAKVVLRTDKTLEAYELPAGRGGKSIARRQNQPLITHTMKKIEVRHPSGELLRAFNPVDGRLLTVQPSLSRNLIVFEVIGAELYVCDMMGENLRPLGRGERPVWSPDGNWIAFMVTEDDGHYMLGSDIYLVRPDGSQRTNLTRSPNLMEMNPNWSPDGAFIAYDEETTHAVYVARLEW